MDKDTVEAQENVEVNEDDIEIGNDPEIIFTDSDDSEDEDFEPSYDEDSETEDDESDDEETSDDDESEPEEKQEEGKPAESEAQKPEPDNGKQAAEPKQEPLTDRQKLVKALASELSEEEIPTTVEFRKAAIAEAKKAVCAELNIDEDDFNTFDEEHQFLFSEKLEQIRSEKKQKFDDAVNRIQARQAEEKRTADIANLINSQCDTKEKKEKLVKVLRGVSTGYTEDMKAELLKGKTDKLQKLIDVATGKKSLPTPKKHGKNTKTNGRDRGYASDLVFGFN